MIQTRSATALYRGPHHALGAGDSGSSSSSSGSSSTTSSTVAALRLAALLAAVAYLALPTMSARAELVARRAG